MFDEFVVGVLEWIGLESEQAGADHVQSERTKEPVETLLMDVLYQLLKIVIS